MIIILIFGILVGLLPGLLGMLFLLTKLIDREQIIQQYAKAEFDRKFEKLLREGPPSYNPQQRNL